MNSDGKLTKFNSLKENNNVDIFKYQIPGVEKNDYPFLLEKARKTSYTELRPESYSDK
jgi:hypothetical protein